MIVSARQKKSVRVRVLVTAAPRSVNLALISPSSYTTSSLSTSINPPSGDLLADGCTLASLAL